MSVELLNTMDREHKIFPILKSLSTYGLITTTIRKPTANSKQAVQFTSLKNKDKNMNR